jgi:hypothetical protein
MAGVKLPAMARLRLISVFSMVLACGDDGSPMADTDDSTGSGSTISMTTSPSTTEDTSTSTSDTETSSESSDTGAVGCPNRHVCLPPAPEGWSGPFTTHIAAIDAMPTACPEGWTEGDAGLVGLQTSPFECDCDCPGGAAVTCEFDIRFDSGPSCNATNLQTSAHAEDECVTYDGTDAQSIRVSQSMGTAECGDAEWAAPMPSTFMRRMDACVPEIGDACSEGQCVPLPPAPFVGRMCIAQDGEVDCPDDGPYRTPYVLADGAEDNRTCPCTCGADEVTCTGTLEAHSDGACGAMVGSSNGACISALTEPGSAVVTDVAGTADCIVVDAGPPEGAVELLGARTLCCTAD